MTTALTSLVVGLLLPLVTSQILTNYYTDIENCAADKPLGNVIQSFPVTSRIQCAGACTVSSICKTFRMSNDGAKTCYLLSETSTTMSCASATTHFQKMTNWPCLNQGEYDKETDTCKCFDGYIGNRCERIMQDCSEGYDKGVYDKGIYWIYPNLAPAPFKVQCWSYGETMIQHQRFANVSFVQSWAEYKRGFGDFGADHWLGNDHVFYITNSRPQTLRVAIISVKATDDFDQIQREHYYKNFKISNESNQYRLTFTSEWAVNDLGNCLSYIKDVPFATPDVDAYACAGRYSSGWWYTSDQCSPCNLNGQLRRDHAFWSGDLNIAFWRPIPNDFAILESAMILRYDPGKR